MRHSFDGIVHQLHGLSNKLRVDHSLEATGQLAKAVGAVWPVWLKPELLLKVKNVGSQWLRESFEHRMFLVIFCPKRCLIVSLEAST